MKTLLQSTKVLVFTLAFFVASCSSDNSKDDLQLTDPVAEIVLPADLYGSYIGMQTKMPLAITKDAIAFTYHGHEVRIDANTVGDVLRYGSSYEILFDGGVLILTATQKENEIRFQYNDLNLGWYSKL